MASLGQLPAVLSFGAAVTAGIIALLWPPRRGKLVLSRRIVDAFLL